jgi:CAAX protease family protein
LKECYFLSSSDNPQFDPQLPASVEPNAPSTPGPYDPLRFTGPGLPPLSPPQTPSENPAWNGWDVLLVAVLTLATMFIAQFALLFGAHHFLYPRISLIDLAQWPIILLLSQFLIDGALVIYLLALVEGKYHAPFGNAIRWNWPKAEWKLLLLGAGMLLALNALESVLPMPKDTPFEKLFERPRDAYLLSIIAVSLGPLVEELFFRGFLYPVLAKQWGAAWAIFLTAAPFAALHMQQYGYAWGALLVIFTVGVVCGIVRAMTRSVGASFLVHVGYNGTQMLLALFLTRGFTHMPKSLLQFVG